MRRTRALTFIRALALIVTAAFAQAPLSAQSDNEAQTERAEAGKLRTDVHGQNDRAEPSARPKRRGADDPASRAHTPPAIPLLPMRPQVDDLFSRDDAAAERMKKRFPDLDKLQALGKAVRDAKDADDQLIKLTAYCSQLTRTRSERTEHQRFSGIKLHFSTIEKFNELTPQLFPERSRRKRGSVSVVYPSPFRPALPALSGTAAGRRNRSRCSSIPPTPHSSANSPPSNPG